MKCEETVSWKRDLRGMCVAVEVVVRVPCSSSLLLWGRLMLLTECTTLMVVNAAAGRAMPCQAF
jgi:hypothetical protein